MRKLILIILLFTTFLLHAQVVLEADGPGNTYELISSKFAPGYDAVESPDCIHPGFGRHIAEVWDPELNQYVFEFYSHVTPDNDRCINTDRQRIEIKTYELSPDNLKGVVGEVITYKWKFRLNVGFKPSSSFTHIHQIKAVGGDEDNPIFTLTPRKGNPNKLELIHDNTTKVAIVNLSLFEGVWVDCTETIKVGANGSYSIIIKKVSDGSNLLSYSNNNIMTIRSTNNFIRPKWGIYRSLSNPADLRDEAVRFAGFSIQEGTTGIDQKELNIPSNFSLGQNYPNPFNPETVISYQLSASNHVTLKIYDLLGRETATLIDEYKQAGNYTVDFSVETRHASSLPTGVYFYRLTAGSFSETKKMMLLK